MNYTIDVLQRNEIEKLCDLIKLVFKREAEYAIAKTKWAFDNSHSHVIIAKYQGKIIAARGGFKWPLMMNGQDIKAIQFHGTCVHPEHRRKGLFTLLNTAYLEYANKNGIDYIFHVSLKASRLGYEKLGWKYIKGYHRLTYFNKPIKYLYNNTLEKSAVPVYENTMSKFELIPKHLSEARQEQFKDLIHTDYSDDFLKWRLNNKTENYKIYNDSDVYIIYKLIETNISKYLVIGDIFLIEKSFKIFIKAIRAIIGLEKPDITYTYISVQHPYYKFYLFSLFTPNPFNYHLNFGTKLIAQDCKTPSFEPNNGLGYLDIDTF